MPFGMLSRVDPRNHVLDGGQISLSEGAILRGKACPDMPICLTTLDVNCAKMAEPIEMPYGVWTPVGISLS